ncbi:MAG: D-alanyl-D-alanine carboxypeptidase family protein [Bacilli bacterium]|nr:D-alanyl-D-alanine carboxypeptidase family protein [Bacilli bacterium]
MKKKKIRVSKTSKIILVLLVVLGFIAYGAKKVYDEYQYKKTYEYKLTEKGYSLKEAENILKLFSNKRVDYILSLNKNENIYKLAEEKYYIDSKLEEYLAFLEENEELTLTDVITLVNVNRHHEFYEKDIETTDKSNTMIVNKYYVLKDDYVPDNLAIIPTTHSWGAYGENQATADTVNAFMNMAQAAATEGINLMVNSSYRDYADQDRVYKLYEDSYGKEYADNIAARPGHSEHQSGYALDIFSTDSTSQKTFAESNAYAWLKQNCYKYGFIIRYPEGKENITGFNFESWHYRYVGVEIATYIQENDITYDEYYAYYLQK